MKRRTSTLSLLLAVALAAAVPGVALADRTTEARALFEAGQRAYQLGDFKAAIQAFEEGYKIEERPGLLFSIGQAHRKQYTVDQRSGHVAVAIKAMRDYLSRVEQGGKRVEAVAALEELEPLAKQLEIDGKLQPLESEEPATRLVISSPVPGAEVMVDGSKEKRGLPLAIEVTPGKHTVVLSAAGYKNETRELQASKGAVTALDFPLQDLPARVTMIGPTGAQLEVDGHPRGAFPFAAAVPVEPGVHQLRVTLNGHEEYDEEIELARDGKAKVVAEMPATGQRKAAVGLLVTGGGLFAGGLVTGGVALGEYLSASSKKSDIDAGKVVCRSTTCTQLDDYNSAVRARDAFAVASGVLLGAAVLTTGGGLALYVFDGPTGKKLHVGPRKDEAPQPHLEVSVSPLSGVGVRGQF